MILLSIIIPCYRCADYLPKLLTHIDNNSPVFLKKVEVIIVFDGSDSCFEVPSFTNNFSVKTYAFENNRGANAARFFGLTKASGKFISFVDADDELSSEYFREFQPLPTKNILYAATFNIDGRSKSYNKSSYTILEWMSRKESTVFGRYIVPRKILSQEMFPDLLINQDKIWFHLLSAKTDEVRVMKKAVYYYNNDNPQSISRDISKTKLYQFLVTMSQLTASNMSNQILRTHWRGEIYGNYLRWSVKVTWSEHKRIKSYLNTTGTRIPSYFLKKLYQIKWMIVKTL